VLACAGRGGSLPLGQPTMRAQVVPSVAKCNNAWWREATTLARSTA
jgi:hypothetical protein